MVHTSRAMHLHYILLSCRERNNFQQLSKLIELKFISTAGPHYLTLANKVTCRYIHARSHF